MHHQERQLQQLRRRFVEWLPWLKNATKADVQVSPVGQGNAFRLTATWPDGTHTKTYDIAGILRLGRVGCTKDYARAFVKEVLGRRGVL
jgi:hypothetical protein